MLRKFSNSVRRKGAGANDACKFRFDFHIDYVDGLPSKVRHCRAQLKRSPKTNISELHPASGGRCDMGETLSFVATMYRTAEGTFEPKQYTFVLQVPAKPEKPSTDKLLVLGDCVLDLARFAPNVDVSGQRLALPVPTKLKRVAQVHGTVTVTIVQARMAVDGLTNISGTEALSSAALGMEQDLSGFSDYDGEGGTPRANRTRDLSSSRGLRPPLAGHTTPDGNIRSSSRTLARMGSTSRGGRNTLSAVSGRTDRSETRSQGGSNSSLTPNSALPNTPKSKHRSGSSIPATKRSPATPPSASAGRRFGTGYALSKQLSGDVDAYDSAQRVTSDQAIHSHSANFKVNSNRTSPPAVFSQNAPSVKSTLPPSPEGRHEDSDSSSLSEMSTGSQAADTPPARAAVRGKGSHADRKVTTSGRSPTPSSTAQRSPQANSLVNGAIASQRDSKRSGTGQLSRADSAGNKIGAEMSAFSETTTTNEHLQRVRGKLQGVQEAPDEVVGDTSALEATGRLSRVDTDDLLEGAVEGTLTNASVMQAQEPKKFSWRRAAGAVKAQQQQRSGLNSASNSAAISAANSAAIGADSGTPNAKPTNLAAGLDIPGRINGRRTGQAAVGGVVAGSPPESEGSTMGGSSVTDGAGEFDGSSVSKRKTGNGILDADLLDDHLALPQTQGKDMFSGMVQDPMESIAPDAVMSTMQGGNSGMGGHSAMQGTLNLAPPYQLQAPKSAGSGAPLGASSQGSIAPRSMEGDTGPARSPPASSPERSPMPPQKSRAEQQAEERAAKLEKELQIEKESSQAAMLSLRNELAVEKESSKAALAQVQGELEQERARSKTSIGRVRKDLESERDSVNSALTEVRADLDRERERSKTLSSTLEATAERSRTITAQLEAANKQVTELKVMRRELEGSRREIEALRKSSADGGVALKELSSTRRELESMKKQADVARADYAEMLEEYERLKEQETEMKKQKDSLSKANLEIDRLKSEVQDARDTAAETQKRHQEEKQAALERMSTITNGKDEEREKLQMQLQQQLQTSEELVQELKSRVDEKEAAVRSLESEKETAVRNLESEKKSISNAAAETKVLKSKLDSMTQERDKAVEEVAKLDEALEAMQNGPNAELMQAWDTERRELLQDLEAAENRVLGMQTQVAEGDMELHKLRKASEQLKREKEALQNDALQLTERTMELEHANRMLTNEMNEKKAGRAKSMRDSWSLDGGGLTPSPAPPPAPGGDDPKKKKTKVVDKADYEKVVNELAELKLEFALGQERETIMRHEVQKARERKAQLEAKLTKIENSMYGGLARLPGAAALGNTDEV